MILLACQCSLALLNNLNDYKVESCDNCMLRLHIGIGAGEAAGIYVGGTDNRLVISSMSILYHFRSSLLVEMSWSKLVFAKNKHYQAKHMSVLWLGG